MSVVYNLVSVLKSDIYHIMKKKKTRIRVDKCREDPGGREIVCIMYK